MQEEIMSNKNIIDFSDIPAAKGCDQIPQNNKLNITMETITMPDKPELNPIGIEETTDAVRFAASVGNAVHAAFTDDGKFTAGDLPKFLSPAMKLPGAITGISKVASEIDDLTDEEKETLVIIIKNELEIDTNVEEIISKSLNVMYEIKGIADLIKAAKA